MERWSRLRNSNLFQAWLVLLLSLVFGMSLAGVEIALKPKIEANKIRETMAKIPGVVLGSDRAHAMETAGKTLDIEPMTVEAGGKFYRVYQASFDDGSLAGFVTKASAQGYADKIELLVGVDAHVTRITGVFVLDQKETPGLGNKIVEEQWLDQFEGRSLSSPLVVVKTRAEQDHEIDAVSGATISSRCVAGIVNQTVEDVRRTLMEKKQQENTTEEKGGNGHG
ncbi:MAG: FMN-binding protein [Desulfobacteraceae bacterium]